MAELNRREEKQKKRERNTRERREEVERKSPIPNRKATPASPIRHLYTRKQSNNTTLTHYGDNTLPKIIMK